MKKKNDDLLRLAFGELSADDASAVEARAAADPSARKELQVCRDLRASLQHLPPPPADNLSAERLRAAILDRELSARKPSFSWNWAPMALAALLAVVFIARPAHRSEPAIVALNGNPGEAKVFALNGHLGENLKSKSVSTEASSLNLLRMAGSASSADGAEATAPVVRYHTASRRADEPRPSVTWVPAPVFKSSDAKEPKYALASFETIASPPSSVDTEAAKKSSKDGEDTVVIVSGKRDLDTGAAAASETEANHVLVGG